jgi:hypothetical protein
MPDTLAMQGHSAPAQERVWPLILLCWLVLALAWSVPNLATLALHTSTTDETMRLLQVRNFLDGAGWYGLHEARLDPPRGLDSHWSRLVDVPIAGLILLGGLFFDARGAELFAMIAWPSLVYLALMVAFLAIGRRLVPQAGPLPMIAAVIACLPINSFFKPLAIDHHGVQITLAVVLTAAALWAGKKPIVAAFGGFCACLATAIGFESLHVLFAIMTLMVALAVFGDHNDRKAAVVWFFAQATTIVPLYLVNTPPDWWMRTACDALQLNMVAVLLVGSLGAAFGLMASSQLARPLQLLLLAGIGGATLALGLFLDPSCIAGPNAAVLPEAITLWMSNVDEAQPLLSMFSISPSKAAIFIVYPAVALCLALLLWQHRHFDVPVLVVFGIAMIATIVMFAQVRGFSYAAVFGALFIAISFCRLVPNSTLAPIYRILGSAAVPAFFLLCSALLLPAVSQSAPRMANTLEQPTSTIGALNDQIPVEQRCLAIDGFLPLAEQPVGLVLAHFDMGPATLLNTPHPVVMAPYHRADEGIVLGIKLMEMPLSEAKSALKAAGIAYLADCKDFAAKTGTVGAPILRDAMLGTVKADWLEQIPSTSDFPEMKFWRVKP